MAGLLSILVKDYEGFTGKIGRTVAESEAAWPPNKHPGEKAPNVIVMLFDDLGFSHLGCFGSTIDTPNIDRLAEQGLRYTNFHVTPLCSPTRAALLTGRNHHAVGMRGVSNFDSGFPHMRGQISNHAATVAEVVREEGYTTFALGKWHLCPMVDASPAGPYDQWPLQRGFDRFYGFLDGETDQFYPELVYDNHWVEPPAGPEDGYHLTEDLVDHAITFVHDSVSVRPDRPFFMYLAFGATHAPHQAPPEYMAKYRGAFDEGWDVFRDRWFARQKELGLLPEDTKLAPRNPGVEAWDTLSENQQRLACRLQEAYAAFLDHTDVQIGRLLASIEKLGLDDNTMIVLLADNGASQEGGPFGVLHEMKFFNFMIETPDEAVDRIPEIGGPDSHANYPWGWAQAGNTPFRWYKQNTHEGGVHVPFVMHWPAGSLMAAQFATSSITSPMLRQPFTTSSASRRLRCTAVLSSSRLPASRWPIPSRTPTHQRTTMSSTSKCSAIGRCTTPVGKPSRAIHLARHSMMTCGSSTTSTSILPSATTWLRLSPIVLLR